MLEISRILLPVDFSRRGCNAALYAIPFAARWQAEVVLLHVLPAHLEYGVGEMGAVVLEEPVLERQQRARRALDVFLEAQRNGLRIRRVLLDGDPATKIVEYAHQESCGLILMPTHGYGPFRRLLLGSVTAKVLHDADCPVWTGVHMQDEPGRFPGGLRRVVCAVDPGGDSARVLTWAARIAAEFRACLTLVHAVGPVQAQMDQLSPEWRRVMIGQAEADLAELQRTQGIAAEVSIIMGEAPAVICAEAARLEADLVVIGRASREGILGRLTGQAYAIIRESPCPVVSV
jgi:nucleotide-binding universal stress UspA family protein